MSRILKLALPAIISNITVPLLGLCDTAVAGHLGSSVYLAAIAAGAVMVNVVYFLCGFLRMGTTGLTAEALGASDRSLQAQIFSRSLFLGVIIGVGVAACALPLCRLLSAVISADTEVADLARRYFLIIILGSPAQLGVMAMYGWMVGMQSTARLMVASISVNVVNVVCSLLAVFVLRWGFVGVAVGTLIANWFGFFFAIWLCRSLFGKGRLFVPLRQLLIASKLKKFFKVNTDLFFRSACLMAVTLGLTSIGARLGADVLAVNTVINQFFLFFSYFMDGFAFAAEALVGSSYGAGDRAGLRSAASGLLRWSAGMALFFFAIYFFGSDAIVALLTSEEPVRALAADLRPWIIALPPISVAAFIFDGFYVGMIATRRMLLSTLLGMVVFFSVALVQVNVDLSVVIALPDSHRLWTAFLLYLLTRGAVLASLFPHQLRSLTPKS